MNLELCFTWYNEKSAIVQRASIFLHILASICIISNRYLASILHLFSFALIHVSCDDAQDAEPIGRKLPFPLLAVAVMNKNAPTRCRIQEIIA